MYGDDPTWEVGALQKWYQSGVPAIQFHSSASDATVLIARLHWHPKEWRRSYASSKGLKE
ncbi:hypothetical protein TIFTF001_044262 [Ficus carica]|uniref:Uncharacterized protein n=1 Tax=Ficus carica TaxID=3494 RepID=A0AA88CRL9_FICCA|nr:hypothetical protein TIFTF001_044261 [Ficus carica]GMN28660.1 hypothetical protein TIFTF001_044262 [Ficus carica]